MARSELSRANHRASRFNCMSGAPLANGECVLFRDASDINPTGGIDADAYAQRLPPPHWAICREDAWRPHEARKADGRDAKSDAVAAKRRRWVRKSCSGWLAKRINTVSRDASHSRL